jgi:hypothetical protein
MHDPHIMIIGIHKKLFTFQLWHKDPCLDGSDDSCGWFPRARHGDKAMLKKIENAFEFEWDRMFENKYFCGWFCPDGDPHLSPMAITLNMFLNAGIQMFGRDKTIKFMQKHLVNLLLFAENNVDSLHDGLTRKFEIGCGEAHTVEKRKERIHSMAVCIYGWMLRETRPWWRHPRWHIWHWEINFRLHFRRGNNGNAACDCQKLSTEGNE